MEGIECKRQTAKSITREVIFDGRGHSGMLAEWKVVVGEQVKHNTVLCVIETANRTFAIRSKYSGSVYKIFYKEKQIIMDGKTIAAIQARRSHPKTYDTAPILEAIAQLQRKRRESERAIEEAKGEEEKMWRSVVCDEIDEKVCEKRKELLAMYKELIYKDQQKYLGSSFAPFSLTRNETDEYCKYVPRLPLDPRARMEPEYVISMRTLLHQKEKAHDFAPYFAGTSISTYPYIEQKGGRDGEPICDQYNIVFSPPLSIIAVADGCNWGDGPAEAALRASKAFVDHMSKNRDLFRSTNLMGHLCLDGIVAAHNAIIAGPYVEGKSIGTTTLLGGVLSKVILPRQENTPLEQVRDWVFVFASIGDCKAFLWDDKKKAMEELTPDSRGENFQDASDCGGRIGPYINGGPDLRNLEVFMAPCSEGDLIFVCSDGVHDNFDPQMQGLSPADLGSQDFSSWNEIDAIHANALKSEYRCRRLKEVAAIESSATADLRALTDTIVKFCENTNLPSQQFMQENLGKRLPSDYSRFPGKMDHTTLVTLRVGEYEAVRFEGYVAERKRGHAAGGLDNDEEYSDSDLDDGVELLLSIKKVPSLVISEPEGTVEDVSPAPATMEVRQEASLDGGAALLEEEAPRTGRNKKKLGPQGLVAPEMKLLLAPKRTYSSEGLPISPLGIKRRKSMNNLGVSSSEAVVEVKSLCSISALRLKALCNWVEHRPRGDADTADSLLRTAVEGLAGVVEFSRRHALEKEAEQIVETTTKLLAMCRIMIKDTNEETLDDAAVARLERAKLSAGRAIKLLIIAIQNLS